jgi:hypothetical protein
MSDLLPSNLAVPVLLANLEKYVESIVAGIKFIDHLPLKPFLRRKQVAIVWHCIENEIDKNEKKSGKN